MPIEARVGQMFMVNLWGTELILSSERMIREYMPGGVALLKSNLIDSYPRAIAAFTNALQQAVLESGAGVPMFIATDQEGGLIARLRAENGFTTFPVPMVLTAAGPAQAAAAGRAMAAEMRAVGINMNLAPVADLDTNRTNPVIARRSFGTDPERVGETVAGFIQGQQAEGIIATAKHFPGHGDTSQDSHTGLPVVEYELDRLRAVELVPFQHAVDAGVGAVMAAHIWFPALEPEEERPASLSPAVLTGLLREEMGFEGLILTDALAMDAIDGAYGYGEAARLAIQAGADMVVFGPVSPENQQAAIESVIEAVRVGEIDAARIDASVRRILAAKARFGLLDWAPLDLDAVDGLLDLDTHRQFVTALIAQAVTLVKDEAGALPLTEDRSVLFVFVGWYGEAVYECKQRLPNARSVSIPLAPGPANRATAANTAEGVDTVVVLTHDAIDIPEQAALVRALPPEKTVVFAMRSPYDLLAFPEVSGYLALYTPLPEAVALVCDVLVGDITPQGVLPVGLGQ